jgi:ABC-2 type transport system permease protein
MHRSWLVKILPIIGVVFLITANAISVYIGYFTLLNAILGIVGLILFLTIFMRIESANLRNYLLLGAYCLFVIGIIVLLYLIVLNHPQYFDLTKNRNFSLSKQTTRFLKTLNKDVKIVAFTDNKRPVEVFLREYTYASPHIKYEIHNPFQDNLIAKAFDTNVMPGDSFIVYGEKKKRVHGTEEATFTNAIVEVTRERDTVIYFLKGHGERGLEREPSMPGEQRADTSLSQIKQILEERALKVRDLELARKGYVPDDCSVLACVGPAADLFPQEARAVQRYLDAGGRALFAIDPPDNLKERFPELRSLLERYGVELKHDIVIDPNPISQGLLGNQFAPLVSKYGDHYITKELPSTGVIIFVPYARTINPTEPLPRETTFDPLLYSSEYSWSADLDELIRTRAPTPPNKAAIKPQILGAAITQKTHPATPDIEARLVVFGDSDIFADSGLNQTSALLFLQSINWLTQQKDLIAIPEKIVEATPIFLTLAQIRLLFVLLVVTLPSLIFFGGLGYTLVRRKMR